MNNNLQAIKIDRYALPQEKSTSILMDIAREFSELMPDVMKLSTDSFIRVLKTKFSAKIDGNPDIIINPGQRPFLKEFEVNPVIAQTQDSHGIVEIQVAYIRLDSLPDGETILRLLDPNLDEISSVGRIYLY